MKRNGQDSRKKKMPRNPESFRVSLIWRPLVHSVIELLAAFFIIEGVRVRIQGMVEAITL